VEKGKRESYKKLRKETKWLQKHGFFSHFPGEAFLRILKFFKKIRNSYKLAIDIYKTLRYNTSVFPEVALSGWRELIDWSVL
jgi:hypothetical protein